MFEQNREAAIAGAQVNTRISESGPYVGVFTDVGIFVSSTGAEALNFNFKSEDGATASFQIYYKNKTGGQIDFGHNKIVALNTTMEVKAATTKETRTLRIFGKEVECECFVEMENKPVGIFLQRELTTSSNGNDYDGVSYITSFRPKDNRLADEIYKDSEPKRYAIVESSLVEVIDKRKNQGGFTADEMRKPGSEPAPDFSDFDDEIPF